VIDPTAQQGAFASVGFIKDDSWIDEHTLVESQDSKGDAIDAKSGAQKSVWKSVLMQTSKDEIDLMKDAKDRYYEMYYKTVNNDATIQELVAPVCRIKPGVEIAFAAATERNIALEIHMLAPATALTRTPAAYNTVQWVPYAFTEGAAANGVPTDAATVPQGGI
jgi:hypothetical protein